MKEEKPIQISEILQMIKTYWSLAWRNKGWVVVGSIVLA
ncbi:MAG: hypothetical protein ACI8SE_001910, partial [Bacteroidia bacterium]